MKRFWFGVGCMLALGGSMLAQDSAPKAKLGLPSAGHGIIVRGAAPEDGKAEPKPMPKASITEAPKAGMLPMPAEMTPGITPPNIPGLPPGAYIVMPGGPVPPGATGPIVATPPGGGPVLGGPSVPTPPIPGGPVPGGGLIPHIPGTIEGSCPSGVCLTPNTCQRKHNWYTSAEFLIWYMRNFTIPPLVTVGPPGSIGALGEPGVSTIFGGNQLETNPRYGGRFTLGYWFSPKWAIEATFFFLRNKGEDFSTSSDQYPNAVIARPFFSANQNIEFAEQIANPGIYSGAIAIETKSRLWGGDISLRRNWWCGEQTRFDGIFGYRYLNLHEELNIAERTLGLPGGPRQFVGVERAVFDRFQVDNNFHGAQIGGILDHHWGRWSLTATAKIAFGFTRQYVDVMGETQVLQGGLAPTQPGGLLALDSNSSLRAARNKFAIVPEASLNLGYDINSHWRVYVGYNFMFWSSVTRPGSQIDRTLDEYRIPDFTTGRVVPTTSAVRPASRVDPESLWVQGISFGIQFKW